MTIFQHQRAMLVTLLGVVFVFGGSSDAHASVGLCSGIEENVFLPCQTFSTSTQAFDSVLSTSEGTTVLIYFNSEHCSIFPHPTLPLTHDTLECEYNYPFSIYVNGVLSVWNGTGTNWIRANLQFYFEGESLTQSIENYVTMESPCDGGDSRNLSALKCQISTATSTITATGTAFTVTPNMKVELRLKNLDDKLLDSVSYSYVATGTKSYSHTFSYNFSTTTYKLSVCLLPSGSIADFGQGECVIELIGNGIVPFDPNGTWAEIDREPTLADVWADNQCDSLGLTDVFPALKCAGIWLFYPSTESVEKLKSISLKDTFPFSYAYDIGNVRNELFTSAQTATSTISATVDIGGSDKQVVFFSKAMVESVPYSATIKTLMGYMLYLALAMLIYRRILTVHDTVTPA